MPTLILLFCAKIHAPVKAHLTPGFRRPDGVKPKVFCLVNVVHIDRRFVAAGTQGQAEFQCHFEVPSVDVAAQHGDRRGVLKRI